MSEFITKQMDYVFFSYGLSLLVLAAVCFSLRKVKSESLPWIWLGLFGLMHGVGESLYVLTFSVGDGPFLTYTRIHLLILSLLCLFEFGRQGLARYTRFRIGRWVYLPLLLAAAGSRTVHSTGTSTIVISVCGFIGCALAAGCMVHLSRRLEYGGRRCLVLAGVAMAAYGTLAAFAGSLGLPIEVVKALCVTCVSLLVYGYHRASLLTDTGSRRRSRPEAWLAAVILGLLVCGWMITEAAGHEADELCRNNLLSRASAATAAIDPSDVIGLKGTSEDLEKPCYKSLRHRLQVIHAYNHDSQFVYLMAKRNGRIVFLADAEPVGSEDYSPPGEIYPSPTPEFRECFVSGRALIEGPVTDEWGTWYSGHKGVRDPGTGRVAAVIGIDINASTWNRTVAGCRLFCIIIVLLLCTLVMTFFTVLQANKDSASVVASSERRYRGLVEGSPSWVSLFDDQGRFVTVNKAGLVTMGWDESEMADRRLSDIWPKENQPLVEFAVSEVLSGRQCSFEAELCSSDGRAVTWYMVLNPIEEKDGRPRRFVGIALDITDRIQVERALSESEERYRLLAENVNDVIWTIDMNGRITHASPSVRRMLGYGVEEIASLSPSHILTEESMRLAQESFSKRIGAAGETQNPSESWTLDLEMVARDGRCIWTETELTFLRDLFGSPVAILGVTRDMTERRRAQETLRETNQRLNTLIHASPVAIITIDADAVVKSWNPAAEKIYGWTEEEIIGRQYALVPVDQKDESAALVRLVLSGESFTDLQMRRRRKDGERIDTSVSAAPLYDNNGQVSGIMIVSTDITEQQRIQEAMKASEEQYRTLFNSMSEGFSLHEMIFDDHGMPYDFRFLQVNDAFVKLTGMSKERIVGRTARELVPDREPQWVEAYGNVVLTGEPVTLQYHNQDLGKWFEFFVFRPSDGRFAVLLMDITERRSAEASLRMQTSAINAAGDQIVITDPEGVIEFVNPAFEKESGYTADEVIGSNTRELRPEGQVEAIYEEIWQSLHTGQTWHGEVPNRRKDGSVFIEDVTITPVKNEAGVIEHYISIKRNVTEKKSYEQQLNHMAHHDVLTGLPNRLLFGDRLTQKLALAKRQNQMLAVMFFDLDHFKLINDTLGHNVGDELLKEVADRLTDTLREVDTIARMGGDEFTVILGDITRPQDAANVANRILHVLSQPFHLEGQELYISASIGISLYPSDGADAETLVKNADTAMYRAKEEGRGNYQLYTADLNAAVLERMTMENSLRKALERDEFCVHYQPRTDLQTGRVVGAEALVRWQHPEFGLVPPARFINLAEETGLIVPISERVMRAVCDQIKAWKQSGFKPIPVAVNISARHFQQGDILGTIKELIDGTGLDPAHLNLEITEGALMQNPDVSIVTLRVLKAMGVQVSIDDFGTGYSSLSYLKRFPIDAIKIDRSFIRNVTTDSDDAAIAGAAVAMAHRLRLRVIAEGVETVEQLEFLKSLNCDEMQGYFISHPVPAEEFAALLERNEDALQAA